MTKNSITKVSQNAMEKIGLHLLTKKLSKYPLIKNFYVLEIRIDTLIIVDPAHTLFLFPRSYLIELHQN